MKYKDGSFRHNRSISIMEKVINDFILENKMSGVLTTIMDIHFPPRGETANVYLSVFPDKNKEGVEKWFKRKEISCRLYIVENSKIRHVPKIVFHVRDINMAR